MKKAFQLFTLLTLIFFAACKQGTGASSNASNAIGTWKFENLELDDSKVAADKKGSMDMAKQFMAKMFEPMSIAFTKEGICEMTMADQVDKAKYTITGDKITVTPDGGQEKLNFELIENKLHMKINQDDMHVDVVFKKEETK